MGSPEYEVLPYIDKSVARLRPPGEIIAVRWAVDDVTHMLLADAVEYHALPGWDHNLGPRVKDPLVLLKNRARVLGRIQGLQTALGITDDKLLEDIQRITGVNPLEHVGEPPYTLETTPRADDELLEAIGSLRTKYMPTVRIGASRATITPEQWGSVQRHPSMDPRAAITLDLILNSGRNDALGYALGEDIDITSTRSRQKLVIPRQRKKGT